MIFIKIDMTVYHVNFDKTRRDICPGPILQATNFLKPQARMILCNARKKTGLGLQKNCLIL